VSDATAITATDDELRGHQASLAPDPDDNVVS
jgi:hypothetical protein